MTSTLFAVATPMHMMAPVSAGTLTVVWVRNSIHTMPASAAGKRGDDDQRVEERLEVHDDQHVDENDGADQPEQQAAERLLHGLDLALAGGCSSPWAGPFLASSITWLNCAATKPRSVPCTLP